MPAKGRQSNVALTAERKEIREILDASLRENTVDALKRVLAERDEYIDKIKSRLAALDADITHAARHLIVPAAVIASAATLDTEDHINAPVRIQANGPPPDMMIATVATDQGAPPMSAILGDLTPGWPEWSLRNEGADAFKTRYGKRREQIPPALQPHAK